MRRFLFFAFIGLILFAPWANHALGDERLNISAPPEPARATSAPSPITDWAKKELSLGAVPAPKPFSLVDLSGGLNYRSPSDQLLPKEALVCQNWLFSRDGGLQVRPGFGKVNTTPIDLSNIWGLYHYSIPNYGKGFLVGDSIWIYKMAEDGTFADSQIYIDEIRGDFTNANSVVNVDFPNDFWNIERKACRGDKISYGSTEYEIKQVYYDTSSSTYKIKLVADASATSSNQAFRIRASNANADTLRKASFVQRNNTVFFSMGNRQNARWNGKLQDITGIYAQGQADTLYWLNPSATTRTDTAIVCNDCNFSTNELAGKIVAITAADNDGDTTQHIQHRLIQSNTANRLYYNRTGRDSTVHVGKGQPFLIYNPIFTQVYLGTVDSIYPVGAGFQALNDVFDFTDPWLYRGKIFEFLDGQERGNLYITDGGTAGTGNGGVFFFGPFVNKTAKKGDRFAIYHLGLQASIQELYYDRLVAAGMPNFVNTIRYSDAGNPDALQSDNFLTLPEQGGDSIVFLSNTNGLLAVGQKHRLWVLVGPPPWDGQTVILASDGIGCIAPRSVVKDGKFLYFAGLRGNIPTIFRWQVEGATVNTAGGGTLFQGGGILEPLTEKIDPMMMRVERSKLDKISAGLFGEHLLVSLPFKGASVNDSTIAINLRTGAIGLWTLAGGLWHNGRAAGDSGQVYFTHPGENGTVFLFGGATDSLDTAQSFTTLFQSGWLDLGDPTVLKQGQRLWARHFRSSANGSSTWQTRTDYTTTNQHTFTTTTTTGERDENSYMAVAAIGKRFGLRFEGSGVRGSFLLKGVEMKFTLRGEGL